MLRVGLTGGIACGKSHVLRRLAARGCRTLDLDAVAREVTAPGGEALAVDRGGLRRGRAGRARRARPHRTRRGGLQGRLGPGAAQRASCTRACARPRPAGPRAWPASADAVLVTDGALLVESGVHLRFDRLVVVHCAPELQLRRLRERDGLDERRGARADRGPAADRREARVRALRDRQLGAARGHGACHGRARADAGRAGEGRAPGSRPRARALRGRARSRAPGRPAGALAVTAAGGGRRRTRVGDGGARESARSACRRPLVPGGGGRSVFGRPGVPPGRRAGRVGGIPPGGRSGVRRGRGGVGRSLDPR